MGNWQEMLNCWYLFPILFWRRACVGKVHSKLFLSQRPKVKSWKDREFGSWPHLHTVIIKITLTWPITAFNCQEDNNIENIFNIWTYSILFKIHTFTLSKVSICQQDTLNIEQWTLSSPHTVPFWSCFLVMFTTSVLLKISFQN